MVQWWKRASTPARVMIVGISLGAIVVMGAAPLAAAFNTEDPVVEEAAPVQPMATWDDSDWDRRWAEIEVETERRAEALRNEERRRAEMHGAVRNGISRLQPWFLGGSSAREVRSRQTRRNEIADAILRAADQHGFDSRIAVAMARRESSLMPSIGTGRRNGSRGEMGYFQIMPNGFAQGVCGRGCDQYDVDCNARTAMCYLDHCRRRCGNDPWLYVGGYGRSRCPRNRAEAATWPEVQKARSFLCEAYENCSEIWPI
jgi:hypothetical protein